MNHIVVNATYIKPTYSIVDDIVIDATMISINVLVVMYYEE